MFSKKEYCTRRYMELMAEAEAMKAAALVADDGLDDEPLMDDHGYDIAMDREERVEIEEKDYKDGRDAVIESNAGADAVENGISLETLRSVLVSKKKDHASDVRALLERFGSKKLSEVSPSDYVALYAEAAKIGD